MGTQRVGPEGDSAELRRFTVRLLEDLDNLERMLDRGLIEREPARIGSELEMFLVDDRFAPVTSGPEVLSSIADPRVTPELGAFNLEVNSSPVGLGGDCLSRMESELVELLGVVREAAAGHGCRVVLSGILPTLEARHASPAFMTPLPRYARLNETMSAARGGAYRIFIKGVDELSLKHESVMLEACNTSFQIHLQVDPARFARVYNLGLLAAAPALAVATNSPLLFGRRLWRETRIALFQQSIDTRRPSTDYRILAPRVDFGSGWVDESVLEIYRDDVARFRALLSADLPPEEAEGPPKLRALQLFNSTVYRWLRPCYGAADGTAHLRIENRILPAGPTPVDQVANAAFWYGLLFGLDERVDDVKERMRFDDVRGNFFAAARFGLGAPFTWLDGEELAARDLILEALLPIADEGLAIAGVDPADAGRYLGIIAGRVNNRLTGAEWQLRALAEIGTADGAPWKALTAAMYERQVENRPVHEWGLPRAPGTTIAERVNRRVGAHMQRDLVTVQATDPVGLAIHLMRWRGIRHLPVEDTNQNLVGLVTRSTLFRFLSTTPPGDSGSTPISDVMEADLVTAPPDAPVREVIRLMRKNGVSSVLVVDAGQLIGLVTERDFLQLAADALIEAELLEE